MQPRVIRSRHLPERRECFPDTALPGFRVANRFLVGASEGPTKAEVPDDGLYVEILTCPPGESLGEHLHPYVEAFFVLDGTWEVTWRAAETADLETETVDAWDLIWVPSGWWRATRNLGDVPAHMLVLAGAGEGCELPGWLQALLDR